MSKSLFIPFAICIITLLMACSHNISNKIFDFQSTTKGSTPWTHENFDNADDKFMFAIISDLNGGERERIFDVAVQQINLLRPEFILSVGDLIDGGTEDLTTIQNEWNVFEKRASKMIAPFFHVGGNHDLTNMVMRKYWLERFGQRYYHFKYKNTLFLIMDSEDYEAQRMQEIYKARAIAIELQDSNQPEKAIEAEYFKMQERRTGHINTKQGEYFLDVINQNPDVKWTFVLMHKPVWLNEDNLAFNQIEQALSNRPYTVINGHFHTYSHQTLHNQDYMMLGTTGGGQNDQSDMAFDHFTLVTMTKEGPSIANIRMDGLLDKTGHIPAGGDTLKYQASKYR